MLTTTLLPLVVIITAFSVFSLPLPNSEDFGNVAYHIRALGANDSDTITTSYVVDNVDGTQLERHISTPKLGPRELKGSPSKRPVLSINTQRYVIICHLYFSLLDASHPAWMTVLRVNTML